MDQYQPRWDVQKHLSYPPKDNMPNKHPIAIRSLPERPPLVLLSFSQLLFRFEPTEQLLQLLWLLTQKAAWTYCARKTTRTTRFPAIETKVASGSADQNFWCQMVPDGARWRSLAHMTVGGSFIAPLMHPPETLLTLTCAVPASPAFRLFFYGM